jgi:hypothetical protein
MENCKEDAGGDGFRLRDDNYRVIEIFHRIGYTQYESIQKRR